MDSLILKFLTSMFLAHWIDLAIILVAVLAVIVLLKTGHKKLVMKFANFIAPRIINALVAEAEALLGSKTGQLKKDVVYKNLPMIIKLLFTEQEINSWIDAAATMIQQGIKTGKFNLLSYAEEQLKEPQRNTTINVAHGHFTEDLTKLISDGVDKEFLDK